MVGKALGDGLVTLDGDGDGECDGVLPATGEKVGLGLATATGEVSMTIDGVGAAEVGARPQADRVTTKPTSAAKTTRRDRTDPTSTCCAT